MTFAAFDGVTLPLVKVQVGVGGSLDPGADYIHLGVGPGLGTGKLAGTVWYDISPDVTSISRRVGRANDLESASPGTMTVVADLFGDSSVSINSAMEVLIGGVAVEVGTPIQFRADWGGVSYGRFHGEIADMEPDLGIHPTMTFTCADGLERLGRDFVAPITPQFDGDTTGARIGRILDAASWPTSLRALDTGYTLLGLTGFGDHALPLLQQVEKTEFGLVWCDGDGKVTFYDRHRAETATRSTTIQASFTDTGGATDIDMAGLRLARSREGVFTKVHILRDPDLGGEDEPTEQVAEDLSASAGLRGLSFPDQVGQLSRTDAEALALAGYLKDRYKTPQPRIREVPVDATTQDRWAQLLPLRLLDRVEVERDYGPATITAELLVQGLGEEITDAPSWQMTVTTSNPPPDTAFFVLGTSQLGSGVLGW